MHGLLTLWASGVALWFGTSPAGPLPTAAELPQSGAVSEATALAIALRLEALADPVRVFSLILSAEGGEVCSCDMAAVVGLSDATVSHHLKVPREAGVIAGERRGTWVYYRPVPRCPARAGPRA